VNDAIREAVLQVTKAEPRPRIRASSSDPAGLDESVDLEAALEHHAPMLLATARALVRNESDARDLVQTTLEIATLKSSDLRDRAALRSWLLAIQVREAFRLRRRLARFVRLSPDVMEISISPGPDADVIALRTALPKLPPRARSAVVLHYLADLSVADVARAMGISENTTKSHLKAGLARLREELGDE
jgi:RNA polymerase sigma-70 factor (ECF subfamily)